MSGLCGVMPGRVEEDYSPTIHVAPALLPPGNCEIIISQELMLSVMEPQCYGSS